MDNNSAEIQNKVSEGVLLKPDSPKPKRKIWLIVLIVGLIIVVGIILSVVVFNSIRVDENVSNIYREAYLKSKGLKEAESDLVYRTECELLSIAGIGTTADEFAKREQACREDVHRIWELTAELDAMEGAHADAHVGGQMMALRNELNDFAMSLEDFEQELNNRRTWHDFLLKYSQLRNSQEGQITNNAIEQTAQILIDSGNDELKNYGESWLERAKVYYGALNRYNAREINNAEYMKYYQDWRDWQNQELTPYAEQGDFSKIAHSRIANKVNALHHAIAEQYEEHYDYSGDCKISDYDGSVHCE